MWVVAVGLYSVFPSWHGVQSRGSESAWVNTGFGTYNRVQHRAGTK